LLIVLMWVRGKNLDMIDRRDIVGTVQYCTTVCEEIDSLTD